MSILRLRARGPLVFAALLVVAACADPPPPVHHPAGAAVQSPCDHTATLHSESRDRLNDLRQCGAIDETEWGCLGNQLDYLGEDVRRRCDAGRLSYANIAGEQRRRYSTCIVPFDPALVECGLFTTDLRCGENLCDPERSLPAVSAAPPAVADATPEAIAGAGSDVVAIVVHGYERACDFRLDTRKDRARFDALIEPATPESVVAHEVPAEFYLRFTMKDGSVSELVVGDRWMVPVGGDRRDTLDGWRLPDLSLRDYLRVHARRCR